MVRPIVRDFVFLSIPSQPATLADLPIMQDLMDTLSFHKAECVGMAANMIGESKRIIVFYEGNVMMGMLNPRIVMKQVPYETEEGCLSLDGVRKTIRYQKIRVEYEGKNLQKKTRTFTGYAAQVVQHELDHLDGILI